MSEEFNYRDYSPPRDKDRQDYEPDERRSEIYDLIEKAGHYRNLQRNQTEIGEEYGVSASTICRDIQKVMQWQYDNLGDNAEVELSELKNAAVRDLLESGQKDKAYKLAKEHYKMLQDMGVKEKEPDKHEVSLKEAWKDQLEDEDEFELNGLI